MINILLTDISQIILNGIFERELDKQLRKKILARVPDKHYNIACEVYHEARVAYFDLGFVNKDWSEEVDIEVRRNVLSNVHRKHSRVARKVFDRTRKVYFDLGFEVRKMLRGRYYMQ